MRQVCYFYFLCVGGLIATTECPTDQVDEMITMNHLVESIQPYFNACDKDSLIRRIESDAWPVTKHQFKKILPLVHHIKKDISFSYSFIDLLKTNIPELPPLVLNFFDRVLPEETTTLNLLLKTDKEKLTTQFIECVFKLGEGMSGKNLYHLFYSLSVDFAKTLTDQDIFHWREVIGINNPAFMGRDMGISSHSIEILYHLTKEESEDDKSFFLFNLLNETLLKFNKSEIEIIEPLLKNLNGHDTLDMINSLAYENRNSLTIDTLPFFCTLINNSPIRQRIRIIKNLLRNDFSKIQSIVLENESFIADNDKLFLAGVPFDQYEERIKCEIMKKRPLYLDSKQKANALLDYVNNPDHSFFDLRRTLQSILPYSANPFDKKNRRLGRTNMEQEEHDYPDDFVLNQVGSAFLPGSIGRDSILAYFEKKGRLHDALYNYAIYGDLTNSKKVFISNYGGCDLNTFDNLDLRTQDQLSLCEKGYSVIIFNTRDNWQTIGQSKQFLDDSGEELLTDTLIELLLFVKAFKTTYPDKELYYQGGSFGATKGAFIALILSNIENKDNVLSQEDLSITSEIYSILEPKDRSLISGFLLMNGNYKTLIDTNFFYRDGYILTIPVLLMQSFDDEVVSIENTNAFYEALKYSSTNMQLVSVCVTPQAADSSLQESCGSSAYCGHGLTYNKKYREKYLQKINDFVNMREKNHFVQASMIHTKRLYDYCADQNATILYRLYFASMHADQKPIRTIQRLSNVFMSYAKYLVGDSPEAIKAKAIELIQKYGDLIIYGAAEKQLTFLQSIDKKDFLRSLKLSADKSQNNPVECKPEIPQSAAVANPPTLEDMRKKEEKYFYLTEDARVALKKQTNALDHIAQLRECYTCIDRHLLEEDLPSDKIEHNIKMLIQSILKDPKDQEKYFLEFKTKGIEPENIKKQLRAIQDKFLFDDKTKLYLNYVFDLFTSEGGKDALNKQQDLSMVKLIDYADLDDIIAWHKKYAESKDKNDFLNAYKFIAAQTLRAPDIFPNAHQIRKHYLLNAKAEDLFALEKDLRNEKISLKEFNLIAQSAIENFNE